MQTQIIPMLEYDYVNNVASVINEAPKGFSRAQFAYINNNKSGGMDPNLSNGTYTGITSVVGTGTKVRITRNELDDSFISPMPAKAIGALAKMGIWSSLGTAAASGSNNATEQLYGDVISYTTTAVTLSTPIVFHNGGTVLALTLPSITPFNTFLVVNQGANAATITAAASQFIVDAPNAAASTFSLPAGVGVYLFADANAATSLTWRVIYI